MEHPVPEGSPAKPQTKTVLTIPTVLTLLRVAAVPALTAVWYSHSSSAAALCCAIFVVAGLTDFLDGYLARAMGTVSAFGAFLDPVADKLMVATALILLCTQPIASGPWQGNAWLIPILTSAIIGREIAMSALREWAAASSPEAYKAVAVSSWGKWKTATQMVSISLLLLTSQGLPSGVPTLVASAGIPLLCIAASLTLWSLAEYMRALWPYM
jgi:CDP-diacylglycerol--glycerol-3-phosphate 3-phosphatidyltransferase